MTFSAQFLALRQIHAAVGRAGPSPALLGGLVRGYANLGLLTEFHWHPAHKVFKARALLYAQRLLKSPAPPVWTLAHRGYAYALAGLHKLALDDLDAAEKLSSHDLTEARKALADGPHDSPAAKALDGLRSQRPDWLQVVHAYCRYHLDIYARQQSPSALPPALLAFAIPCGRIVGQADFTVQQGLKATGEMPECYRVHDGVCRFGSVATGHSATTVGLMQLGEKLSARLQKVSDLPASVQAVLFQRNPGVFDRLFGVPPPAPGDDLKTRPRLFEALLAAGRPELSAAAGSADAAAGDRGELSWSVLGHLVRELSFVQVWRRIHFERHSLGWPPDATMAQLAPLIAGHRYRAGVECLTTDVAARRAALAKLGPLSMESAEFTAFEMYDELWDFDRQRRDRWYAESLRHNDGVARDLELEIRCYDSRQAELAQQLIEVSPGSPLAQSLLIRKKWSQVAGQAAAWEKEEHPAVLKALGQHYAREKQYDDAVRCLTAAIGRAADMQTYETLADVYQKQGDEDQWLATLKAYLKEPDYGLHHGQVQDKIAHHFARRGQWEEALPYAEAAARTGAAWAMLNAGGCQEVLQHWKAAEEHFRSTSRRYENWQLLWYFFCKRTGRGARYPRRPPWRSNLSAGRTKRTNTARWPVKSATTIACNRTCPEPWPRIRRSSPSSTVRMPACTWPWWPTDSQDAPARDAALEQIKKFGPAYRSRTTGKPRPVLVKLAELMARDLAAGGHAAIDLTLVRAMWGTDEIEGLCVGYFLGKYLDLHGRPAEAVEFWKETMAVTTTRKALMVGDVLRTLAGAELLRHDVEPADYNELLRENRAEKYDQRKAAEKVETKQPPAATKPLPAGQKDGKRGSPGSTRIYTDDEGEFIRDNPGSSGLCRLPRPQGAGEGVRPGTLFLLVGFGGFAVAALLGHFLLQGRAFALQIQLFIDPPELGMHDPVVGCQPRFGVVGPRLGGAVQLGVLLHADAEGDHFFACGDAEGGLVQHAQLGVQHAVGGIVELTLGRLARGEGLANDIFPLPHGFQPLLQELHDVVVGIAGALVFVGGLRLLRLRVILVGVSLRITGQATGQGCCPGQHPPQSDGNNQASPLASRHGPNSPVGVLIQSWPRARRRPGQPHPAPG